MAPPNNDPEDRLAHDDARNEETPLLGTDLPPDVAPDKKFQALVISMCVLFIFIVEVGVEIMAAPGQQVLEDILCREHYPDHKIGVLDIDDERCKAPEVQKDMAMLRSWDASTGMLIRKSVIQQLARAR